MYIFSSLNAVLHSLYNVLMILAVKNVNSASTIHMHPV